VFSARAIDRHYALSLPQRTQPSLRRHCTVSGVLLHLARVVALLRPEPANQSDRQRRNRYRQRPWREDRSDEEREVTTAHRNGQMRLGIFRHRDRLRIHDIRKQHLAHIAANTGHHGCVGAPFHSAERPSTTGNMRKL
jgi:hypothetical protein